MKQICEICKKRPASMALSHGDANRKLHLCVECAHAQGVLVCEVCREAQATVHLTNIENNVKRELHLCQTCAQAKGFHLQGGMSLPTMLSSDEDEPDSAEPKEDVVCDVCGISWREFRRNGRLGCPHDYEAFREFLTPLIADYHERHVKHVGKTLTRGEGQDGQQNQLELLRCQQQLAAAVAREDYELAAALRDRLQQMNAAVWATQQ